MGFQEPICKLCLEKCENFRTIDVNTKNILDILLLKIDFTVIQEPVMCVNCAEMLMMCSDFKAICLRTHDFIAQFVNQKGDIKLDLKNIYLSKDVSGAGVPEDQDVCGFCMSLVRKCSTLSLDVEEGDVMLKKMIEQCLPEIDLRILKKPVICASCHGSLENCFRFVTNCLIVEEKIKKYCETVDANGKGQIELSRVLQFTERNVTRSDIDGNSGNVIKVKEELIQDRKNPEEMEIDNGRNIIKLEQIIFSPSENGYVYIENKTKQFLEMDDQKVSNEHHVIPKDMLTGEEGSNELGSIKREEVFYEDETKLKKESLVEMEDQTFLFNKEIEIKTDEHDFGRIEDGVTLPHPEVTTKLCGSSEWLTSNLEGGLSKSHVKYTLTSKHVPKVRMNYYCDCCSFQTKNRCDLKKHLIVHKDPSEVTMHKCDFCLFQTKFKGGLKRHLLLQHKDPSEVIMHKCDSCSYQTKYKSNLKGHSLLHKDPSEVTMHKCDFCLFQTKHKGDLRKHLLMHKETAEVTMYKCDSCPFQAKYKDYLKKHLLCHKEFPEVTMFKCNSCSYQTKHKRGLKTHLLLHKDPSEVIMYKCDSCSYQTRHKKGLTTHLLKHKDPSEVTMHKCDSCSYQSKYKCLLKKHLLQHEDPSELPIYNCDSCSFETKCKEHLKRHLLKHKEPSEVTMYKCDSCSYQVKDKRNLKRHLLKHKELSEVTMYKCESCSYQTIYKGLLKKHLVRHEDPSKLTIYNCDSCSYQSKYKANINKHVLKHNESSEVTMYKCETCSFQTKSKLILKKHLPKHKDPS